MFNPQPKPPKREKKKYKGIKAKPKKPEDSLTLVFEQIWEDREHLSEVSGTPLLPKGHPQWHWQFSHILGKSFSRFRDDKRNIILKTVEEHRLWGEDKGKIKDDPAWQWIFLLEEALMREYYEGKEEQE